MSGQSLTDRITAAQHSVTGSAVSKTVCKATTHEVMGPKKKHLDCEYPRGDGGGVLPALPSELSLPGALRSRAGLRGCLHSLRPRGDVERRVAELCVLRHRTVWLGGGGGWERGRGDGELGRGCSPCVCPPGEAFRSAFLYAQSSGQCELLKGSACPVPLPRRSEGIEQRNGMLFPHSFVSLVSC